MVKEEEAGEETESLTLIDTRNGFNTISRLAMIWTVRHHWPLGSIFALNCYRHEAQLVVQRPAALFHILTIRERVTQQDTISMVLYVLALLTLAQAMWEADLEILQPCYADNTAMQGPVRCNAKLLCVLIEKYPFHVYFPDQEKSWHICAEGREEEESREAFDAEGVKVRFRRGQRNLGGFCGGQ